MKKNINHNHSTKGLIQEKSSSIVFFIFCGKFGVGERDEMISLTFIALLSSFKCIKIAVTKSYLINCVSLHPLVSFLIYQIV